jgi:hypothetical protein
MDTRGEFAPPRAMALTNCPGSMNGRGSFLALRSGLLRQAAASKNEPRSDAAIEAELTKFTTAGRS